MADARDRDRVHARSRWVRSRCPRATCWCRRGRTPRTHAAPCWPGGSRRRGRPGCAPTSWRWPATATAPWPSLTGDDVVSRFNRYVLDPGRARGRRYPDSRARRCRLAGGWLRCARSWGSWARSSTSSPSCSGAPRTPPGRGSARRRARRAGALRAGRARTGRRRSGDGGRPAGRGGGLRVRAPGRRDDVLRPARPAGRADGRGRRVDRPGERAGGGRRAVHAGDQAPRRGRRPARRARRAAPRAGRGAARRIGPGWSGRPSRTTTRPCSSCCATRRPSCGRRRTPTSRPRT